MSGFASNTSYIEYIDDGYTISLEDEAAGKVGKVLSIIAAVVIPFAAPAVFGAIAGSGVLGASLASAAAAGTIGTFTSVLGSAVVGGLMSAGVAYASGARGGDVWRAAGVGAIGGGLGGWQAAGTAVAGARTAGGINAVGGTGPVQLTPGVATSATPLSATAAKVAATGIKVAPTISTVTSSGIASSISRVFGNVARGVDVNRIGAMLINAAVNNQSMGRLDGLVAQQRAELDALRASDTAAYNQRIAAAQQILSDADRMDPTWLARVRMADVAGMEANQFRETMRNIATRQGGSLDTGQRKAYERAAGLHTARSKALAYNQGYDSGLTNQNNLRTAGAGLLGPNDAAFNNLNARFEIEAAQERARREADNDTFGGLLTAFGNNRRPATSPDPSSNYPEDEERDGFTAGLFGPFG